MAHRHRSVAKLEKTYGWTHCVAPEGPPHCDGRPHGGVTFVAVCSCGAKRLTESNGRFSRRSSWQEPDDKR